MSSSAGGVGGVWSLLLSFLAGGAAAVAIAYSYLESEPQRKMKRVLPSILEAYLQDKDPGIGEEVPSTPKADGYRMPAEWEAHSGCAFKERGGWLGVFNIADV